MSIGASVSNLLWAAHRSTGAFAGRGAETALREMGSVTLDEALEYVALLAELLRPGVALDGHERMFSHA